MNRSTAIELDKFYTRRDVADECRAIFLKHVPDNAVIVEPSAGNGAFLGDNIVGFDIAPESTEIGQLDFLNEWLPPDWNGKSVGETEHPIACLGNPPFGRRGELAAKFINRAQMYAKVIAFILPLQFRKWSAQRLVTPGLKLVVDHDLPADAFTLCGKPYSVRCCFQIWSRDPHAADLRLSGAPATRHPDFEAWQYNCTDQSRAYLDGDWDFAVQRQGYGDYRTRHERGAKLDPRKQWIMFSAKGSVLARLRALDFEALSRRNTSTPGFGKADVVAAYIAS